MPRSSPASPASPTCGIAGFVDVFLGVEGGDPSLLDRLGGCPHHDPLLPTPHRSASVGLASCSGVSAGPDGQVHVALDGVLYNADGVRAALAEAGHAATASTHAELAAAAYVAWGDDALEHLDGAWALAIHDARDATLRLARDHFGRQPLYVCRTAGSADNAGRGGWLFASTITPILASGLYDRKVNERTLFRYLRFGVHDDERETFFDGIERVEPGELVTVGPKGVSRRRWSTLPDDLAAGGPHPRTYDATAADEYRRILADAVHRRRASSASGADRVVGTALSGGLASAAIALLDDTESSTYSDRTGDGQRHRTEVFTASFPDSAIDERRYVDDVVRALQHPVTTHRVEPTASEFKRDLLDFVRTQEEPVGSSGPYAHYRLVQDAAGAVDALLDGCGSDETLAGHPAHLLVRLRGLRGQPGWRGNGARGVIESATEVARSLPALGRVAGQRAAAKVRSGSRHAVPVTRLLADGFVAAHADERHEPERLDLRRRLREDTFATSLPAQLRYQAKNAKRFGVDVHLPFVDATLVRYLAGLSDDALVEGGRPKRILRDAVQGLVPESVLRRRDKVAFTVPQGEWLLRIKNHVYSVFLSESFADRPYFNAAEVLGAFEGWIKNTASIDSMTLWRLLNVELWLQAFFDEAPIPDEKPRVKTDYEPNVRKQLDLTLDDGQVVRRYPLRTELFTADDDLEARVIAHLTTFVSGLDAAGPEHAQALTGRWYLFISEKIVAITQGRSYFIWDIEVGAPARLLSRYVTRTPAGIGLGSPFTMQLAIDEAGLPRVLYAAVGGFVGKLVGRRGLFYDLVGGDIRAIDGPTEYSVYPANVSAKLGPKDPDDVAQRLSAAIRDRLPAAYRQGFAGTVVMDANDLGRNALGQDAPGPAARYEAMFADNPLGQGSEQTPMAAVVELP